MVILGGGEEMGIKMLDISVTRNRFVWITNSLKQSYEDGKIIVNFIFHECHVISVNDMDDSVNWCSPLLLIDQSM